MKRVALVACALALLPVPAAATVMLSLDLPQLVGRADQIFVGKVLDSTSRWTADGRRIVTDTTVEVKQPIHGAQGTKRVVVRSLGGTVDGIGMRVAGAVVLHKGEEVLLFTEKRGGHRFVVGMRQGVFRLARDARGHLQIERNLQGLELIDAAKQRTSPAPLATGSAARFVDRIRATISSCRNKPQTCRPQLQLRPASVDR